MDIVFYNYNDHPNKLNKTLGTGVTISGNFNMDYDTSDTLLKITIPDIANFNYNYCYVPLTGRYYFVTVKNINRVGIVFLSLHIDVLQTYKTQILNAKIRLTDTKTNNNLIFKSQKIVNNDFVNILVTLGGV